MPIECGPCEPAQGVYIADMVRDRSFAPISAIALSLALVFQTLLGCGAAHASAPVMPITVADSGHCDNMSDQQMGAHRSDVADPDGGSAGSTGNPAEKSHDCAKMCHPIAMQSTTAQMVQIALISASLDAPPQYGSSSSTAQPATPPPKNG